MTKEHEALKLALEALEIHSDNCKLNKYERVYFRAVETAIKEALAQPEQERELAFAGVKVWVGNQQVIQGAAREDFYHADDPWTILRLHSEVCIAALKERNQ